VSDAEPPAANNAGSPPHSRISACFDEKLPNIQDKPSRTPLVHTPPDRQTAAGFPWSVLVVVVIGMGVVLALVFMRRRAPTNSYAKPRSCCGDDSVPAVKPSR
jgi:hypothetical protein